MFPAGKRIAYQAGGDIWARCDGLLAAAAGDFERAMHDVEASARDRPPHPGATRPPHRPSVGISLLSAREVAVYVRAVATVVIECYTPQDTTIDALTSAARTAAAEMRDRGVQVEFVRSLFVPGDETCLHVFETASSEAFRGARANTGLAAGRVLDAVESTHDRLRATK